MGRRLNSYRHDIDLHRDGDETLSEHVDITLKRAHLAKERAYTVLVVVVMISVVLLTFGLMNYLDALSDNADRDPVVRLVPDEPTP